MSDHILDKQHVEYGHGKKPILYYEPGYSDDDIETVPEGWHRQWAYVDGTYYYGVYPVWMLVGRLLTLYDAGILRETSYARIVDVLRRGCVLSRLKALSAIRFIDEKHCHYIASEYAFALDEGDVDGFCDAYLVGDDFRLFKWYADAIRCSIEIDWGIRQPLDLDAPKKRQPVVSTESRIPVDEWFVKFADVDPSVSWVNVIPDMPFSRQRNSVSFNQEFNYVPKKRRGFGD